MIASIPSVQSAHDFFMDAVFVLGVVPMYLNFATRIVNYICVVIWSCVLFARHEDIFSSLRIYFLGSLLSCDL
jgi:hypothetical protein